MAKKKKKKAKKRSASSMVARLDAAGATAETVTSTIVATKPRIRSEPKTRGKATCGVCGKADQIIVITDIDEKWEDKGHPDQFERDVCGACISDYRSRDACSVLVYKAMLKQLRAKEFSDRDIDQAIRIAWRTFNVAFDHKALVSMARKLKVKHPWLKGKKAK